MQNLLGLHDSAAAKHKTLREDLDGLRQGPDDSRSSTWINLSIFAQPPTERKKRHFFPA